MEIEIPATCERVRIPPARRLGRLILRSLRTEPEAWKVRPGGLICGGEDDGDDASNRPAITVYLRPGRSPFCDQLVVSFHTADGTVSNGLWVPVLLRLRIRRRVRRILNWRASMAFDAPVPVP